jgi:hypothetical protein
MAIAGTYFARSASASNGWGRIVYRLEEAEHQVVVVRIDHRSDVYRRR